MKSTFADDGHLIDALTVDRRRMVGLAALVGLGAAAASTPRAEAAPAPVTPGLVSFDSFGATDDARVTSMNAYHQAHGGRPTNAVALPARVIAHSVPILLYSGMALKGPSAAREFSRKTVLAWRGGNGTSQLKFPTGQNYQSYPSDGSPRDITFENILFTGGPATHWMPKVDPTSGTNYAGHTLWYTKVHDCGWVGFSTVWWGYGDGCTFSGIPHLQAIGDTAFHVGGSECSFYEGGFGFQDSGTSTWASSGKPFFRSLLSKSRIGGAMLSSRGNSYSLQIVSGHNLLVTGLAVDAPDDVPTDGAQIKILGGQNVVLTGLSLKGGMNNPGVASGGAAANRGLIHISGGSDIVIDNCTAIRRGTRAPAGTPFVWAGGTATRVKIGLNALNGWSGVVRQQRAGIITCIDPTMRVTTG